MKQKYSHGNDRLHWKNKTPVTSGVKNSREVIYSQKDFEISFKFQILEAPRKLKLNGYLPDD